MKNLSRVTHGEPLVCSHPAQEQPSLKCAPSNRIWLGVVKQIATNRPTSGPKELRCKFVRACSRNLFPTARCEAEINGLGLQVFANPDGKCQPDRTFIEGN